jgi:predicted hotdog family 3-hydroxylacyl-ACP dehydratase
LVIYTELNKYFPNVEERLKMKLNLTQNFTAIVTGHGKTKAYLHRFKIIDDPTCTCGKAVQTTDHLIYECETLTNERKKLKATALQKTTGQSTKKKKGSTIKNL